MHFYANSIPHPAMSHLILGICPFLYSEIEEDLPDIECSECL